MSGELNFPTTQEVGVEAVVVVLVVLIWNVMSVVSLVTLLENAILVEVGDTIAVVLGIAEAPAMEGG